MLWRANTHIEKGSHLFPHHTWQRINIFITRNGFLTLTNVVIVDPTHLDTIQCVLSPTMHVATIVIHEKTCSYVEHTSRNDFHSPCHKDLWLFSFLFKLFLTICAQAIIAYHQWSSLDPAMFISYYQHVSIALQCA